MPDPGDPPPPPPAPILAGLLRLIASGAEPIEAEPPGPGAAVGVACASGWWLVIRLDPDCWPVHLLEARPPSQLLTPWTWGAQRDDWTAGPDARVITPLNLLTAPQRAALHQRLQAAPRIAVLPPAPWWDVDWLELFGVGLG